MSNFIVYNNITGEIVRSGSAPAEMIAMQTEGNQSLSVMEGVFQPNTYVSFDNVLVPIPPSPGDCYTFDYGTKRYIISPDAAKMIRLRRNLLLSASDWTQLSDIPPTTRKPWLSYRQALRDITLQAGFPDNILWPVAPV